MSSWPCRSDARRSARRRARAHRRSRSASSTASSRFCRNLCFLRLPNWLVFICKHSLRFISAIGVSASIGGAAESLRKEGRSSEESFPIRFVSSIPSNQFRLVMPFWAGESDIVHNTIREKTIVHVSTCCVVKRHAVPVRRAQRRREQRQTHSQGLGHLTLFLFCGIIDRSLCSD